MANDLPDGSMKETEIGPLPTDWQIAPLGDLATLSTGGTPSREKPEYWNGTIPWVKTGEVNYCVIRNTEERITTLGMENSSTRLYPLGTLLVAMYGQGVTRGRVAILGIEATINQACAAVRVGSKIDRDFLFFAFMHQYEDIRDLGHGANQRNLNMLILRGVKFPVPPIAEQQAIAHVLRTVQRAKQATEKVIAAARQLKQSLMRHLLTYGSVPVEQADQVLLKEMPFGSCPESWPTKPFGEVVTITSGQVDPRQLPYLKMLHVGPENIEEATGRIVGPRTAEELHLISGKYLFGMSDVLYSKIRPYLRKAALPDSEGICSADMYPLKPRNGLQREFLFCWLLSEAFTQQAVSFQARTGIPKINRQQLEATLVPVPPADEQHEISIILLRCDQKVNVEERRLTSLSVLFKTLLHHLMTGKVRVSKLEFPAMEEGSP